jgi:hypothetical protein
MIILRRIRWSENIVRMGGGGSEESEKIIGGKATGKEPLGIPIHIWVDDINMVLAETVYGGVEWIGLAQDKDRCWALVNAVMKIWVPLNA